jgi:flagellar assembly protein FliH
MSWSSEPRARGRVLSGTDVQVAPADLGRISARPARALVVDPALVESARHDGYDAGYAEGFDRGYSDGLASAQQHTQLLGGLVQRLHAAADALMARETTARDEIEDQVVATAVQIAEALVGHALADPDERGRAAIARALALAPEQGFVTARVNPADLVAIGDPTNLAPGRALDVVPDPSVAPGDCVVDVGACRIDARIAAALERVHEVLA